MCLRVSSPWSGRYVLWNSKIHQALHQERKEKNPKIQLPTPFKDCFSSPSLLAVFSGLNKAADFAGDQVSFEHSMEPAPPPASADWQCHDNFSLKSLTFQLYFFFIFFLSHWQLPWRGWLGFPDSLSWAPWVSAWCPSVLTQPSNGKQNHS